MPCRVAVATYIRDDAEHLVHSKILRLEDLARNTTAEMADVWSFLGLPLPLGRPAAAVAVQREPNAKHQREYCAMLAQSDGRHASEHRALRREFGSTVARLGYNLDEWECVQRLVVP
jgi:predicted solute-binding protein